MIVDARQEADDSEYYHRCLRHRVLVNPRRSLGLINTKKAKQRIAITRERQTAEANQSIASTQERQTEEYHQLNTAAKAKHNVNVGRPNRIRLSKQRIVSTREGRAEDSRRSEAEHQLKNGEPKLAVERVKQRIASTRSDKTNRSIASTRGDRQTSAKS